MSGDATVTRPDGIDRPDRWPDRDLPDTGENAFVNQYRQWLSNPDTYTPPEKPTA